MTNPLRTPDDYELFLYTLADQFSSVQRSDIVFIRRGATLARVAGEVFFEQNIRLVVRERILYHRLPAVIDWYGYEVWQGCSILEIRDGVHFQSGLHLTKMREADHVEDT